MKLLKKNILFIIIIMQPILDIIAYFSMNTKYSMFAFLIRSLILVISTLYVFFEKKEKKYYLFIFLIMIYSMMHFANLYFGGTISIIEDIKEFVRVFYMPILAVNGYYIFKDKSNTIEQIKRGIICNTFIIFSVILFGLITNTTVYTYAEKVGLRGWFYNSNSQSIILCFCVPMMLFYLFKTKNIFLKIVSVLVGYFLLFTNGTTGCYLMIVPSFGLILLNTLISNEKKKSKVLQCVFLIIVISSSLFLHKYSPDYKISVIASNSYQETQKELDEMKDNNKPSEDNSELNNNKVDKDNNKVDNDKNESNSNVNKDNNDKIENNMVCNDVECQLINQYFDARFVKDYGYDVIKEYIGDNFDVEHLVNNRYRKKLVAKVIFNESNVGTKVLGFGFSNIKKYDVDLETDYSAIMYYFGYLGLLIYLIIMVYAFYIMIKKIVKNPKILFNMEYILHFSMLIMFNLFAEVSGSLLKRPNVSIYVALLLIIIMIKDKEKDYAKKSIK